VNNVAMTEDPADATEVTDAAATPAEPADEPGRATKRGGSDADAPRRHHPAGRQVSLSVRTLLTSLAILVLAVALGVMTWLYIGERATVQAQLNAADGRKHAEQIALTTPSRLQR